MFQMFEMLPTDDMKSWAFRLAHFGIAGGLICLAIVILLLFQNFYLIVLVRSLRTQLRNVQLKINGMDSKLTR